jgi:hypothetical protein
MEPVVDKTPKSDTPAEERPLEDKPSNWERIMSHIDPSPAEETEEFVKMIYEGRRGRIYIPKKP